MAPPAAIANAVEDALGHLGVRIDSTPITPTRLAALLRAVIRSASSGDRVVTHEHHLRPVLAAG